MLNATEYSQFILQQWSHRDRYRRRTSNGYGRGTETNYTSTEYKSNTKQDDDEGSGSDSDAELCFSNIDKGTNQDGQISPLEILAVGCAQHCRKRQCATSNPENRTRIFPPNNKPTAQSSSHDSPPCTWKSVAVMKVVAVLVVITAAVLLLGGRAASRNGSRGLRRLRLCRIAVECLPRGHLRVAGSHRSVTNTRRECLSFLKTTTTCIHQERESMEQNQNPETSTAVEQNFETRRWGPLHKTTCGARGVHGGI